MSEILPSSELNEEIYIGLLTGIANHEAKALILATMGLHSTHEESQFSSNDLDLMILKSQGSNPGWAMSKRGPFIFCQQSLAPIGAVAKETFTNSRGQSAVAYGLTTLGKEYGLAMSGLILDWSLKCPGLSVQTVLGSTQSKSDVRAPVYRTAILESILTAGDEGISIQQIKADHPDLERIEAVVSGLRGGAFANLVTLISRQRNHDPLLRIFKYEYSGGRGGQVEDFSVDTQIMYSMMKHLVTVEGTRDIRASEFVAKTKELFPDIAPERVRQLLLDAACDTNTRLPGMDLSPEDDSILSRNKTSNLRVSDEFVEPLSDLLSKLYDFQTGSNLGYYRQRALEIAADPELCAEIMAKAARNSIKVRVNKSAIPVGQLIMNIMSSSDVALTTQEIREKLEMDHNLPVTVKAVHNYLSQFIKDGKASKQSLRQERQGKVRAFMYYSLVNNEE